MPDYSRFDALLSNALEAFGKDIHYSMEIARAYWHSEGVLLVNEPSLYPHPPKQLQDTQLRRDRERWEEQHGPIGLHGTYYRYTEGCRCDKCSREAHKHRREYLARFTKPKPEKPKRVLKRETHGEPACYEAGCRCELCTANRYAYPSRAEGIRTPRGKEPNHGTYARYNGRLQCRCDECKQAARNYWNTKRARQANNTVSGNENDN